MFSSSRNRLRVVSRGKMLVDWDYTSLAIDVGVGGGKYKFRPKVYSFGYNIYLDIEIPSLSTKEIFRKTSNIDFIVCDACKLPFRANSADIIYASHVIEHLNHPELFIRECYQILKEHGELHIETPNILHCDSWIDIDHKHHFSLISLQRLLKANNFRITRVSPDVGFACLIPPKSRIWILGKYWTRLLTLIYTLIFSNKIYIICEKNIS